MVFFYHVDTIDIASPWFSLLPKLFFGSGFNNLFCATTLTSFRLLPASLVKRGLFLLLMLFLFTSCLISGISTYGCFELQSIILQVCSPFKILCQEPVAANLPLVANGRDHRALRHRTQLQLGLGRSAAPVLLLRNKPLQHRLRRLEAHLWEGKQLGA